MRYRLLLLLPLCLAIYLILPANPKGEIRRTLNILTAKASFEGDCPPFEALAYAQELTQYVHDPLTLRFVDSDESFVKQVSQREQRQRLAALRSYLAQGAFHFELSAIERQGDRYLVTGEVRLLARERGRDDYFAERHMVKVLFGKQRGRWVIENLENEGELDPDLAELLRAYLEK